MVFFRTRLGKILIWQKNFKHESPTLTILMSITAFQNLVSASIKDA